ncbi:MAG: M36 family metallopeptidase, partial [Parafilimonas sp.]
FQQNNMGRGGSEKDFLYADAQDGGGKGTHIDNANFAPTPDGSSPRQQMYLWYPSILKGFVVNSPNNFKGGKPAQESNVSSSNKIAAKGPITSDIVIYKDALFPDSSNACGAPSNKAELAGKIVYIDRGSCNFTVKFHNAQSAGAKAIIVGNVSPTDPRYTDGTGGNRLLTMSATPLDNTITIPGFFIQYDTAKKIKAFGTGNVNATLAYAPFIDGEIDNTIPTHEYTHGISNRLVGGPKNVSCLQNAEQMGEGWSDWYAIMITQNWANSTASGDHIRAIGNYAYGLDTNYTGIRVYPYSTNFDYDPWTYDSLKALKGNILNPADPHTIGEMWTTMLWDMTWRLVKDYGISNNIFDATAKGGNNIALTLVTQGLKLTKCSPGFADGRDGILKADTLLFSGKYSPDIWRAFAKRGLGYSSSQGASNNTNDGISAYDLPPSILPVTISEFTAQKQGNTALLKWTTVQESNTDKFIAERSEDGKVFASVGEVKAAGNSSVQKYYQLTDATPLKGNNIYRIKEIDKDGKSNLSDLRSLNFTDVKPYIKISPNPANNIVTVNIPGNTQNLTLRLLSNTGQLIGNYVMNSESYKIDVSKLAAGVYNILIDGNGYSTKYKLVIQ